MNPKCCKNCFSECEIQSFIESDGIKGYCDYCGSRNVYISDVADVGNFIMEGIERYYEDAANQVGYDSSEGGYLLATLTIAEILLEEEEIFGNNLDDPDHLLDDLVSNDGTPYVRKDPYGPPSGDPEEIRHWENFCKTVKNKQRFTTFLSSEDGDPYDHSKPENFLFHLAHNLMPTFIEVLPAQTKIYRARIHNENRILLHEDLTSPSPQHSRNSRMSPAGISFFYGGMTPEVCIHEVRPSVAENVIVAEFEVIQNLFVLNLGILLETQKSIFNSEYEFSYEEFAKPFLEHFVEDISKPIRKTDSEIEYAPTQVLTEFIKATNFKTHFSLSDSNGNERDIYIDGFLFKSSAMKDGINLVLFNGPDISTIDNANSKGAWLLYKGNTMYQITEIRVSAEITETQPNA